MRRAAGKWRVMGRDDQRAPLSLVAFGFRGSQLLLQEVQLRVADLGIRDHPLRAAFTCIGIETNEFDEWSVQREIHARLIHGGSHRSLAVRSSRGLAGAEVGDKGVQGLLGLALVDSAVVIARNGENGRVVIAVRIVELLEVILLLAEIINHVAQMIPEDGAAFVLVVGHGVSHGKLELRSMNSAGVTYGMKG